MDAKLNVPNRTIFCRDNGDIIEFHGREGIIPLYRELVKVEFYGSFDMHFKLLPEQRLGYA